ncbi:Glycosyl phosphatidyl inositol anchor synthesis [Hanseniaspora valbyensis]
MVALSNARSIFILIGVAFHLFYLWSIFDIYFISPLVKVDTPISSKPFPDQKAPAKRLFLIVGDGLRADTTFDLVEHPTTHKTEHLAPFIRSMALNNGTWGISHTRMPTESRPGHVAMIAGFYEDVSAVTKGWKENPVDFDSCFNRSTHTFSFGSPDILPMFKDGAVEGRVDAWMYGHEFEDFSSSSIELDAYSFNHFYQLLDNTTTDAQLNDLVREDGNIFFLHLLGCDTAGHSKRPYSKEYYDNVKYIDTQISLLVPKIHEFFGDEDTAFIFTADHGMSAFGSHGDGHPNNTRTPLVAWGAGVNLPKKTSEDISDEYTSNWKMGNVTRNDVNQADITSLMTYLLGHEYPVNSVGELPLSFIDAPHNNKMMSLLNNAKSILEQYKIKEQEIIAHQFVYKVYHPFSEKTPETYLRDIELAIKNGRVSEESIVSEIETFMKLTLEGLNYLTTYNWVLIRSIVTLGFIGWISYSFMVFVKSFILKDVKIKSDTNHNYLLLSAFVALGSVMNYVLYYQNSPFNFYMYLLFPLYFWYQIINNFSILQKGAIEFFFKTNVPNKSRSLKTVIFILLQVIGIFECIVYGFFKRYVFTIVFILLSVYPLVLGIKLSKNIKLHLGWTITCFALSTFTTFDAVKIESLTQINIATVFTIAAALYSLTIKEIKTLLSKDRYTKNLIILQILLIAAILYVTNLAATSLQQNLGLPRTVQIAGWALFLTSLFVMPIAHIRSHHSTLNNASIRILLIFVTFAPTFVILSISFEMFFYFFFSLFLVQWLNIETKVKVTNKINNLQILRVCVLGFFLLQIAFFGTGNVASISPFSLDSVYRLLPIFDPFAMGALLIIKLIIPYVILSASLGLINLKLHMEPYTISSLVISISDILPLNFFYLLKTEGSWLDIGITISNYCLAILSSLFMIILEIISHIILVGVKVEENNSVPKRISVKKV